MKKLVALLLTFFLVLSGCNAIEVTKIKDDIKTDSIKFHDEYNSVPKDNLYEYVTYDTLLDTINEETAVIYLGFPSCALCGEVTPLLNEVAKEKGLKKILYYDFKEIRDGKTDGYMMLTDILSDYVLSDDESNKRITAPTIVFVRKGKIVGVYIGQIKNGNSEEIITDEEKNTLKDTFRSLIDKVLIEDEGAKNEGA